MKQIKVSETSGVVLDWLVAKCEGEIYSAVTTSNGIGMEFPATDYSTDWSLGGPIIEREGVTISPYDNYPNWSAILYETDDCKHTDATGHTPLIAAMRCYVASKLGDTVEIPKELT